MDPNTTLAEIRRLAALLYFDAPSDETAEFAEAVWNLDEWLCKGGFLPTAWEPAVEAFFRS